MGPFGWGHLCDRALWQRLRRLLSAGTHSALLLPRHQSARRRLRSLNASTIGQVAAAAAEGSITATATTAKGSVTATTKGSVTATAKGSVAATAKGSVAATAKGSVTATTYLRHLRRMHPWVYWLHSSGRRNRLLVPGNVPTWLVPGDSLQPAGLQP